MRYFRKTDSAIDGKHIPYRTKFRRTKFSAAKIFRRTKLSAPAQNFGSFVRLKFFLGFLFPNTFYKKIFFILIWHVLNFSGQNISADKIFGGQNFSADKIFGSQPDFRKFCPPKFCPIRYPFVRGGSLFTLHTWPCAFGPGYETFFTACEGVQNIFILII